MKPRPERTRRLEDGGKPEGETIAGLLDEFVDRYVRNRQAKRRQYQRTFECLIKPAIGSIGIYDLRRVHVIKMLDTIADENGPVQADRALALIRKAFNWRATRDEHFYSPIVKGMTRSNAAERARTRILADDEIRDLWAALDMFTGPARYPAFVRALFLTATRRREAAEMRWDEIDGDTLTGARYKTKTDHAIPLSAEVRTLIGGRPKDFAQRPFIYSATNGEKPFGDYSKAKKTLDKKIDVLRRQSGREPMAPWTLHDLRRTARSLMSRAGVPSDYAERALGRAIPGIRSVYDHHKYLAEEKTAFEALAAQIDAILNDEAGHG